MMHHQVDSQFWRGKRVLITGHTGFKGGWLSLWLQNLGAHITGLSLEPPTTPNLFTEANVGVGMKSFIGDIRDLDLVRNVSDQAKPEVIFHLAAQPLVRFSYAEPLETYSTNIMGTLHVLEAARSIEGLKAVVNITTDKCYQNKEWVWGYRESEAMGGYDPYSSSKACSELITSAYRSSFFQHTGIHLASARAGNVIGGGDWAIDRLVPDLLRSLEAGKPALIRNPNAIRPWQHVLEPLSGYLLLAERLCGVNGQEFAEAWNFGPRDEDAQSVGWIANAIAQHWGDETSWVQDCKSHPHEAHYLKLDISKARARLNWMPVWSLADALEKIVNWQHAWRKGSDMKAYCLQQISQYEQQTIIKIANGKNE